MTRPFDFSMRNLPQDYSPVEKKEQTEASVDEVSVGSQHDKRTSILEKRPNLWMAMLFTVHALVASAVFALARPGFYPAFAIEYARGQDYMPNSAIGLCHIRDTDSASGAVLNCTDPVAYNTNGYATCLPSTASQTMQGRHTSNDFAPDCNSTWCASFFCTGTVVVHAVDHVLFQ